MESTVSLSLLLEMAVSSHGERIALSDGEQQLTYAELAEWVARAGAVVRQHGAANLVFVGRNGIAFPQLMLAAAAGGAAFAPLNYRLSVTGLHDQLDSLPAALVVCDADYLPAARGYPAISTAEFMARVRQTPAAPAAEVDAGSAAVVLFTSGTTSRPKAVLLRHENLLAYIVSTVELGAAEPADTALVTVPPYHIAAVGSALSNLYAGRRVVYLPDFDPQRWLALVREQAVTTAMVVPTMLARIIEVLAGTPADTPDLRLISYGGARMPLPVLLRAMEAFSDTGFCNAYGLTETSSTIALLGPDDHRQALASLDPTVRGRLASVGRPVPGIEVQLRDQDGAPVTAGGTGELWVRGPQVSGSYAGQGSVLDEQGWFPTRDLARVDEHGFLYIEGRADDTIIRGGENIHPAEIEDVLVGHPAIKEAAVVGVSDEDWGQRIVAVLVARTATSPPDDDVRAYVRQQLRGARTPDQIVWRAELPHTPTGKVLRRQIVAELC
jgi:acyl-CoA synthetase (AMP-forming)/AMP-acid ligase II